MRVELVERVCWSYKTSECVPGQIVQALRGGGGVFKQILVQGSICCDGADEIDESQSGTPETDGTADTYVTEAVGRQRGRHLAAD